MSTLKQIDQSIDEGESLMAISQAYSEISSSRLNKIRYQIEANAGFTQELAKLFHLVREESFKRKLPKKVLPSVDKKAGIINILLTSNYRFYGGLERSLIHYFLQGCDKIQSGNPNLPIIRIVIGKTGVSYLQAIRFISPYQPFIFKTDLPNDQEVSNLVDKIRLYETILVYHSKFKGILKQVPQITDVSQTPPKIGISSPIINHLYEPEIDKILEFFDSQIIKVLFQQTILESELSRTAYRLISMDQAQNKASDYIKQQKKFLNKAKKSLDDVRMLDTIASFAKWKEK